MKWTIYHSIKISKVQFNSTENFNNWIEKNSAWVRLSSRRLLIGFVAWGLSCKWYINTIKFIESKCFVGIYPIIINHICRMLSFFRKKCGFSHYCICPVSFMVDKWRLSNKTTKHRCLHHAIKHNKFTRFFSPHSLLYGYAVYCSAIT